MANEQDFWNGDRNIETEHERMFSEQGIKIKALIARKQKNNKIKEIILVL